MKSRKVICPCCGCVTLQNRGYYEICHVCFWEDEPVASEYPDEVFGSNHISLNEARKNYQKFGACEQDALPYVNKPTGEEIPSEQSVENGEKPET